MSTLFLTSGKARNLNFGTRKVVLRRAPAWQTALGHRPAGLAVNALAWLGAEHAPKAMAACASPCLPKRERCWARFALNFLHGWPALWEG
jgi:hypothetical protein